MAMRRRLLKVGEKTKRKSPLCGCLGDDAALCAQLRSAGLIAEAIDNRTLRSIAKVSPEAHGNPTRHRCPDVLLARLFGPADRKRLVVVARRQRLDDEMPVDRAVRPGVADEMAVNREVLRRSAARNDI
jgi:hypothetical protein